MANVKATTSGTWDTITWDPSTPTTADDVYANTNVVIINQNIDVASLRTQSAAGILAGGRFEIYEPFSVVLSSGGIFAGSTTCLQSFVSASDCFINSLSVLGGTTAAARGLQHNSQGSLRISSSFVRGGTLGTTYGICNQSVGSIYITATTAVSGGINATAHGILNNTVGFLNIEGDVFANVGAGVAQAASGTGATAAANFGTIFINGDIYAYQVGSVSQNGFIAQSTSSRNEITGSLINGLSGRQAIFVARYLLKPKPFNSYTRMAGSSATNDPVFFYSPEAYNLSYVPHVSSVRGGVGYAAVPTLSGISVNIPSQLVGTMEIPDKNSVAAGELVGEEYGIAILKGDDLGKIWDFKESWNTPVETFNGTVGQRLQNILTIEQFGNIIKETTI